MRPDRYNGLGERILGSDGTIEHGWSESDWVNGEKGEFIRYSPEKVNRPHAAVLTGKTRDQHYMSNWMECIRTRKIPNAPVDIGYRSAIAAHMANLAYRRRQRITLEEAKAVAPQF